jgi:hypothetical protein
VWREQAVPGKYAFILLIIGIADLSGSSLGVVR